MNTTLKTHNTSCSSHVGCCSGAESFSRVFTSSLSVAGPPHAKKRIQWKIYTSKAPSETADDSEDLIPENLARVKKKRGQSQLSASFDEMMDSIATFDLRANVNTLMFLNGAVLVEKGMAELWDIAYGDGLESNLASIFLGLTIIAITRVFNLPLAEWKKKEKNTSIRTKIKEDLGGYR